MSIAENIARVRANIAAAAKEAGREGATPDEARIMLGMKPRGMRKTEASDT